MSVVEQRYQAVLAVVGDGRTVKKVAAQVGVARQTLHRSRAVGGLVGEVRR
jgi:transposase